MSFKDKLIKSRGINKDTFSFTLPFEFSLIGNDYWALLFMCCISLFQPKLFSVVVIYMLFKINKRVTILAEKSAPLDLEQLVLFIHMNHLQSLTEAIESNPQLLYCDYKKKSLLHWCKVYNNSKATTVITQMTQKYPKEKLLAA